MFIAEYEKNILVVKGDDGIYLIHRLWYNKEDKKTWYPCKPGHQTLSNRFIYVSLTTPFFPPHGKPSPYSESIMIDKIRYQVEWREYNILKIYAEFGKLRIFFQFP